MHILFATDGSESSREAAAFIAQLTLPPASEILIVCVIPVWMSPYDDSGAALDWPEIVRRARPAALATVHEFRTMLARSGLTVRSSIRDGEPAGEIITAAGAMHPDLVIVGSKGESGLRGFLHGSVAREVAENCLPPVLVARAPRNGLKRVIVATDGSEHAQHAVDLACRLPLGARTEMLVVHVEPAHGHEAPLARAPIDGAPAPPDAQLAIGEMVVSRAVRQLARAGRSARPVLRRGEPAVEIHQLATDCGADLIIAGARGGSALRALVLGSVADRLLGFADCSVLIARERPEPHR